MQAKIQSDVKDEISKNQRDYFLREQMRAIHRELGEQDERAQEIEEYQSKIRKRRHAQGGPRGSPTNSSAGWSRCIPIPPKPPSSAPIWTGWWKSPGARPPRI